MPAQPAQDTDLDMDMMEMDADKPQRTGRSAAGRKGGLTTAARRGSEFYREIGRKGGKSRGGQRA